MSRTPVVIGLDVMCWLLSYVAFAWWRFDGTVTHVPWTVVMVFGGGTGLLHAVVALSVQLRPARARVGSFDDVRRLGWVTGWVGIVAFAVNLHGHWLPRSLPLGALVLSLALMPAGRVTWRRFVELVDGHPAR